jgi:predicted PurR-regulated permease PerM
MWLLLGLVLGVLLAVALIEWWSHHERRMALRRTRREDSR